MRGQKTQPDRKKKYICMYKSIDKIDIPLQFEWDEAKRRSNIEKHGIDFSIATHVFQKDALITQSAYSSERRWMTLGLLSEKLVAVVFTVRNGRVRIISARRAKKSEREAYYARHS